MKQKTAKQYHAEIIRNEKIAEDHFLVTLHFPRAGNLIKPGQFFNVKVKEGTAPLLRRPLGVHDVQKNTLQMLYKKIGPATTILSHKRKNETLDILGPLGNGFKFNSSLGNRPSPVILVAGGHGAAPLFYLAKSLIKKGIKKQNISIVMGASTKKHIMAQSKFVKLGLKVFIATEDGSKGHKGLVTDLLTNIMRRTKDDRRYATDDMRPTIFACGPNPMLKAVANIAGKYKVPCQVSMEGYMGCGTGMCMGCAVNTTKGNKLVCKDGPVFNAEDIIWMKR